MNNNLSALSSRDSRFSETSVANSEMQSSKIVSRIKTRSSNIPSLYHTKCINHTTNIPSRVDQRGIFTKCKPKAAEDENLVKNGKLALDEGEKKMIISNERSQTIDENNVNKFVKHIS